MDASVLTYFAYGSNTLSAWLRKRCPSARIDGKAELRGFELRWHKRSKDGSGKCDIVRVDAPEAVVHGVLYEIDASEKPALDLAEGAGHGYQEATVVVLFNGVERGAMTYQATDVDGALLPYSWYRAFVVSGAREHRLPEDYIALLEAVHSIEDEDRDRHTKNISLIEGACA